jgi:hypothetical protein
MRACARVALVLMAVSASFGLGAKAAGRRAAIRAVSAYAVAIAHPLARSTASRCFFSLRSATGSRA